MFAAIMLHRDTLRGSLDTVKQAELVKKEDLRYDGKSFREGRQLIHLRGQLGYRSLQLAASFDYKDAHRINRKVHLEDR